MAAEEEEPFNFEGDADYANHRRLKSIFDARDLARSIILTRKQEHSRGEAPLQVVQSDARSAVEMFIAEVEHMAIEAGSRDLLNEVHIHTVYINPPDDLFEYFENNRHNVRSKPPKPKPAGDGVIDGLWGYLVAPEVFTQSWTIQVDVKHKGPQSITAEASTKMPLEASVDAYRRVNQFLKRVNLDLEARLEDYKGDEGPGL